MKTSRLRSNFSRKHVHRMQTAKHKKPTKRQATKRHTRFRRRKTRYIMHGTKRNKKLVMRGGASINFKKYDGYDFYGNPVNTISYSSPMEWDA
jgi:hypothetical protein